MANLGRLYQQTQLRGEWLQGFSPRVPPKRWKCKPVTEGTGTLGHDWYRLEHSEAAEWDFDLQTVVWHFLPPPEADPDTAFRLLQVIDHDTLGRPFTRFSMQCSIDGTWSSGPFRMNGQQVGTTFTASGNANGLFIPGRGSLNWNGQLRALPWSEDPDRE